MYEQYKFNKLKDILLFTISKNKKPIKLKKIYALHSEINERTINSNLSKILLEKLIKIKGKFNDPEAEISLNLKKSKEINKRVGEELEHGWEVDWKNATAR